VTFRKAGKYYYLCTVGAHVQYGMFGNLRVKS
jgi:plastocyanin